MKILNQADVTRTNWFGAKRLVAGTLALPPVSFVARIVARHVLPPELRDRLPVPCERVTYHCAYGGSVTLTDARRDLVAKEIHWGGGRPIRQTEAAKLRCIETLARECATFLDIGAYSGVCALAAARANPDLRAAAFDIVPDNYLLLMRNIIENDLVTRVEAHLRGIGPACGEVTMPATLRVASLPTSVSLGSRMDGHIRVPISTLDIEAEGRAGPFLVKIDVEGFEFQVFQGGAGFLARHRPDIVCEVLSDASDAEAIDAMLAPLGYRFYAFTANSIERRTALRGEDGVVDWLLTTRDDIADLVAACRQVESGPPSADAAAAGA